MHAVEWLGIFAGALTTCSFIPQIIRVFKLKSAHEISLMFNLLFLVGTVAWLAYGTLFGHPPIILWNSIAVVLIVALLVAKIKYGKRQGKSSIKGDSWERKSLIL